MQHNFATREATYGGAADPGKKIDEHRSNA